MSALALTFTAALALAQPSGAAGAQLVPDVVELKRQERLLRALLDDEGAVRDAAARLHNTAAALWRATPGPRCRPEVASLLARAAVLLVRHRHDAQSISVRATALEALMREPTVAPLVGPERERGLLALAQRGHAAADAHLELRAWHLRWAAPVLARCPSDVADAPGIGPSVGRTAIIVRGEGPVCPSRARVRAQVAVVPDGVACQGGADCDCVPAPVLPGATIDR